MTSAQDAMRQLFKSTRDLTGNLPPLSAIFPDAMAPIIRIAEDGERQIEMMRIACHAMDRPDIGLHNKHDMR